MLLDGNEIDALVTGLYLNHNSDKKVILATGGGNVGIGTSSPEAKLDIRVNSSPSFPHLILHENSSFDRARLIFEDNTSSNYWTLAGGTSGNHANSEFRFYYSGFGDIWTAKGNGDLLLNGHVGIGTSGPLAKLHIKQSGNSPFDGIRLEHWDDSIYWETYVYQAGGAGHHYSFAFNGTAVSRILTGGQYIELSDRKLKKNIQQLEPVLDRVLQLSPSRYRFKHSPASTPASIGFVAQEVEPLFPEFVSESDGTKMLAYANFGVIAIKAIQEQQELIQALQQRIENLEARLN